MVRHPGSSKSTAAATATGSLLFPAAVADPFTSSFVGPIAIEYPLAISGENRMAISTGAAQTRQHPRTEGGVGRAKVRSFVDVSNSGGCQRVICCVMTN